MSVQSRYDEQTPTDTRPITNAIKSKYELVADPEKRITNPDTNEPYIRPNNLVGDSVRFASSAIDWLTQPKPNYSPVPDNPNGNGSDGGSGGGNGSGSRNISNWTYAPSTYNGGTNLNIPNYNPRYYNAEASLAETYDPAEFRNNYVANMKKIMDEERQALDEATEARYKTMIDSTTQKYNSSRDELARNQEALNRRMNEIYGANNSGLGLSNRLRAELNYNNNMSSLSRERDSALLEAEATRADALANALNQNATRYGTMLSNVQDSELSADQNKYSAWLSNYLNRLNLAQQADYNIWNAQLNAEANRANNAMDYDYRKYIASLNQ